MKKHCRRIAVPMLLLYGIVLARLKIWKQLGPFGVKPIRHKEIALLFSDGLVKIEWNPFHTLLLSCTTMHELIPVVLFNFFIFFPVGFLLPLCLPVKKCLPCMLLVAVIGIVLNLVSFTLHYSILDLGDILMNILGGLCGWTIYYAVYKKQRKEQIR